MTRDVIIQHIIDRIQAKTYLEIGVQRGKNFFKIKAPSKSAVDPNFMFGVKRTLRNLGQRIIHGFYEKTSDDFFKEDAPALYSKKPLDVSFIDGLHTFEQSLLDFENSLKFLSPNGLILFHDCNPQSVAAAEKGNSPQEVRDKYEGMGGEWNGDVWKTIVYIRSHYPDLDTFVFDCDQGVGVARRKANSSQLKYDNKDQVNALTYNDLAMNRNEFLNLKQPDYLHEFLRQL